MPSRHSPRSFDPVALGRLDTQTWASYYPRHWGRALRAFVRLMGEPVVEWWRTHRARRRGHAAAGEAAVSRADLETALVEFYAHVDAAPREAMREAARWRAEAMDLSDVWVAAGGDLADPHLTAEPCALVASHTALLDAYSRVEA